MNVTDNKCLSCGAPLNFDVNTQKWICNYCNKVYSIEDLQHNIDSYNKMVTNNLDIFECSNCGAKVIGNESTSSTKCIYCGSSVIIKKRLEREYKPDYIITFKKNEDEIKKIISKNLKSKFFSDSSFGNIDNIVEVNKLYVPYWLLTCEAMSSIKGILYYQTKNHTTNKLCSRLGAMRFNRVPADAKRNLDDELLQGIEPFNYDEMIPFEYPYLAGMVAECYDQNLEDITKEQIKKRVEEASEDKLRKTIRGGNSDYFSVTERSTFIKKDKFEYILAPIWFVKVEYKGKIYQFCVNDQTGKVAGKRQLNGVKVSFTYIISILLVAFAISLAMRYPSSLGELIFYIIIALYLLLFGALSATISSYKKVKKGKKSSEYVVNGSFELLASSDQDSF